MQALSALRPPRPHPASTRACRRSRRTVIRRTEYGFTGRDIIQNMTKQTRIPADRLFESVFHDPRDNRRSYQTCALMTVKRNVMGGGFYFGGIHIKPTDDAVEGYIPYPPFYCDKSTIDGRLAQYGDVTDGGFVRTSTGVRISQATGFDRTIIYNTMDIRRSDDIRYCTYCKRYRHSTGRCRTRQVSMGSGMEAHQQQLQQQYHLEIDVINECEKPEHSSVYPGKD